MAAKAYTSSTGSSATKPHAIIALACFVIFGWAALIGSARAQVPVASNDTSIGAESGINASGSISINQVAGVGNQQTNASLMTNFPGQMEINQASLGNFLTDSDRGSATIGASAFSASSGLVQVSQTSGAGNIAANAAFVGVSATGDALTAISLSQLRGGFVPVDPNSPQQYAGHYAIAPSAFSGTTGLVQVQQTVGTNNVAANTMSVHMQP